MNSRLKPKYLKAIDAPKKFTIVVDDYAIFQGVDRSGKVYEYDYVLGTMPDKIPRMINLSQASILYLSKHGFTPTEEGLKKLIGETLGFEVFKGDNYMTYTVVRILAKKADTKS